MSARLPLGRSLYVGGNSETRLKLTLPLDAAEMTKRLAAERSTRPVFKATWYFCHFSPIAGTIADA